MAQSQSRYFTNRLRCEKKLEDFIYNFLTNASTVIYKPRCVQQRNKTMRSGGGPVFITAIRRLYILHGMKETSDVNFF
jgi:hypothetical protein